MSCIDNLARFHAGIHKSVACTAFLLLFILALCGCGGGNSHSTPAPINYTGDGTSGLRGVVTGLVNASGATTPPLANATVFVSVINPIGSHSSSNPPVGGTSKNGIIVAQTRTDAQGNYSVPLIPGNYTVDADYTSPTGIKGSGGGGEPTVMAHQFASSNLVVYFSAPIQLSQIF